MAGEQTTAREFVPPDADLAGLAEAVQSCRGCDLYRNATQAVFGEGSQTARILLLGEQPGDQEDRAGAPFVGPAGRELDRLLEQADIDRDDTYVTNVVKHFKFDKRGKRRIHEKPNAIEIRACLPWLHEELGRIRPEVLVTLGATATQALLGRTARVTQVRGQPHDWQDHVVVPTIHPSAIIRRRDDDDRRAERERAVADLRVARDLARG